MIPGTRKPLSGPPPSAGVLAKYARAYAHEAGIGEGRVRAWISYMIMAGILERAAAGGGPRFTIKGGVALELRLRDRARATKDIDIVLHERHTGLREACEAVFHTRGTHAWPPTLEVPLHWGEPFARLARELDLRVADVQEAMDRVRAFIGRIRNA